MAEPWDPFTFDCVIYWPIDLPRPCRYAEYSRCRRTIRVRFENCLVNSVATLEPSPAASVAQKHPWVRLLPALALIIVAGFVLRWPTASIPLERDEGEYAYIAQHWLKGEVPYRSAFDQKPPGVFVVYAVIEAVFGTSPAAIHWAMQVYTSATLVLIFLLGWRLFEPSVGLLAATAAVFLTAMPSVWGNAANTEIFMLLPITAAVATALRAGDRDSMRWALVTGLLSGVGLLFKQVAIFDAIFCLLLLAVTCKRSRAAVWTMVAGAAAVGVVVIGYFCAVGAFGAFYDCILGYNMEHVAEAPLRSYPMGLWRALVPILWEATPFFALAAVGLILSIRRPSAGSRGPCWMVAGWLLFTFLGVIPGGYFSAHYFLHLVPPLALLASYGAVSLGQLLSRNWPGRALATVLVGGALAYGITVAWWYFGPGTSALKSRRLYGTNPFPESMSVAQFIAEHSQPDDTLFIVGSEPQIAYYADRKSASRYIITYPLWKNFPDTHDRQNAVVEELWKNQPKFIVAVDVRQSNLPSLHCPLLLRNALADMLARAYEPVAAIPMTKKTPMPLVTDANTLKAVLARQRQQPWTTMLIVFRRRADQAAQPP
jgi:4-amino-4-deoxy-L-arabinose transferase-like glycosyltransferase